MCTNICHSGETTSEYCLSLPLLTFRLASKAFPLWELCGVTIQVLLRSPTRTDTQVPTAETLNNF